MLRPYFSSIGDLACVLDEGVHVGFTNVIVHLGNARKHRAHSARYPDFSRDVIKHFNGVRVEYQVEIKAKGFSKGDIDTFPPGFRTSQWKIQAFLLLHEFAHLFHMSQGFELGLKQFPDESLETEIDQFTEKTLTENPSILEELVEELTVRPNCFISYDGPSRPPFHGYHRGVVRGLLIQRHHCLDFSNPRDAKLLAAARKMGIQLYPRPLF